MTDLRPTLTILDTRRRGRPKVGDRSTLSIWLPSKDHDVIIRRARAAGLSVSAYSRAVLLRAVRKD